MFFPLWMEEGDVMALAYFFFMCPIPYDLFSSHAVLILTSPASQLFETGAVAG